MHFFPAKCTTLLNCSWKRARLGTQFYKRKSCVRKCCKCTCCIYQKNYKLKREKKRLLCIPQMPITTAIENQLKIDFIARTLLFFWMQFHSMLAPIFFIFIFSWFFFCRQIFKRQSIFPKMICKKIQKSCVLVWWS